MMMTNTFPDAPPSAREMRPGAVAKPPIRATRAGFEHPGSLASLMALAALAACPVAEAAPDFGKLEKAYAQQAGPAVKPFSAERGKAFWFAERDAEGGTYPGEKMNCATCHGQDLKQAGQHNKSGKRIEPMGSSVNSERYTDPEKVEKWFTRNCKQVLHRECTAQEKGDVLRYLAQF